jgi:hypothetical protein
MVALRHLLFLEQMSVELAREVKLNLVHLLQAVEVAQALDFRQCNKVLLSSSKCADLAKGQEP